MPDEPSFDTRCVLAAGALDADVRTRPLSPPVYLASVFETPTLDITDAAMTAGGADGQYIYRRNASPNVTAFERAMAALEGGEAAVGTASGMGAIAAVFLALLSPGDRVLAARDLYGSTSSLLTGPLRGLGIETVYADPADPASFEAAARDGARLLYAETVSNPLMRVADVQGLAEVAHRHGALLVVDATFTTPVLSRPLEHGADIVIHSATKYLGGHSDVTAGVAVGDATTMEAVRTTRTLFGPACSPLDAWLALRGLATLPLRIERHARNAQGIAEYLASHEKVRRVYYAGLSGDPHHQLARRVLPCGPGGMLSFELEGGREAIDRFLSGLAMIRFAASLADVRTTVSYPALTSHRGIPPEERATLGIGEGLVRVSAGIEALDDIRADVARGLAAV